MEGEVRLKLEDYDRMRDEVRAAKRERKRTLTLIEGLDSFFQSIAHMDEVQKEMATFNAGQDQVRFTVREGKLRVQLLTDE